MARMPPDCARKLAWAGIAGLSVCLLAVVFFTLPVLAHWQSAFAVFMGISLLLVSLPYLQHLAAKHDHCESFAEIACEPVATRHEVAHCVPDLLWFIDYASRTVTSLNNVYADTHPQATGADARLVSLLPARVSRLFLESLIEVQGRRDLIRFEYQIGEKSGATHTFEARMIADGAQGCIAIIREISHIKATEEALINQQIFLQMIVDNSPDLIFVRDRHGRFLLVNRATQATLGHDLLTQSHTGLTEDHIPFLTGDHEVLQTGETAEIIEKLTLPNGQTRWYSVTKLPLVREDDTYLLCIAVDITHFHASEAAELGADSFVRAIVEGLPTAFVLLENGGIVFANRAACQLLESDPDSLIGVNLVNQCQGRPIHLANPHAVDCAGIALQLIVLEKA